MPLTLKFQINAFRTRLSSPVGFLANKNGQFFEKITKDRFLLRRKVSVNDLANQLVCGFNIFRFEQIRVLARQHLTQL